ncbi:hypothetical protein VB735_31565 [Halotia wernerae UHCC 0503]|nr:hypothetical protein [Halotia wernerae UHCC 0503]
MVSELETDSTTDFGDFNQKLLHCLPKNQEITFKAVHQDLLEAAQKLLV